MSTTMYQKSLQATKDRLFTELRKSPNASIQELYKAMGSDVGSLDAFTRFVLKSIQEDIAFDGQTWRRK